MSSTTRAKAADDAPSIGWMLGMSSWMLLTVVPGPIVTWLGFSIIGVVSRSRRLIILGVVWGAAAILVSLEIWGQWQPLVRAIVYLSGMLVALMVNPGWLRIMWQRRLDRAEQAGAASFGRVASRSSGTASSTSPSAGAAKKPSPRSSRRSRAAAARAAAAKAAEAKAAEAKAAEAKAAEAKAASETQSDDTVELASAVGASSDDMIAAREEPAPPAEAVDVNTATAAELEDLPGMTRSRARRAVKEREAQGGFTSVEDFGETVGLQPHEIVRLRRVATCSPRPRGERRFGRRVDY